MPPPEGKGSNGGNGGGGNGGGNTANSHILVQGTEFADLIDLTTTPGSSDDHDFIDALGGDDHVEAGGGDDVVDGGDGDDFIDGGAGNDELNGEAGNDVLFGGEGDDTLNGGSGDDQFYSEAGNDTIDGGSGSLDTIIYDGVLDVDYTLTPIYNGGGNKLLGYTVTDLNNGWIDEVTNVENIVFLDVPGPDDVTTNTDARIVPFDETVTIDVLANDDPGGAGDSLTITGIDDVQIDLDGDGIIDVDLIPDDAVLADYLTGVELNDGSILTLNPDDTLTWDPNGAYDIPPDGTVGITFWYEATDTEGNSAIGDVVITVAYPSPAGDMDFDAMLEDPILQFWYDGPGNEYRAVQTSSATNSIEARDVAAAGDFDYDNDGDEEWRVWTEGDGTTHELNLSHMLAQSFEIDGLRFEGLDPGETATISYFSADGGALLGTETVTAGDLDANGFYDATSPAGVGQIAVEADAGAEFFVDDIFFV